MYEANGFEMTSIPQPLLRPQMTFFSSFIIFQMKTTSELREALPLEALLEEGEKALPLQLRFWSKKVYLKL